VERDEAFRMELFREAVECLLSGDISTGKAVLRDFINATTGFQILAEATKTSAKSLMRMFSDKGNPRADNLLSVLSVLQTKNGIVLKVEPQTVSVAKVRGRGSARKVKVVKVNAAKPKAARFDENSKDKEPGWRKRPLARPARMTPERLLRG
jgi:DNA-binding phage protein